MTSEIVNRRDLDFLLYEFLDMTSICEAPRFSAFDREAVAEIFNSAEQIAEQEYLPFAAKLDANGPEFVDGKAISIPEVRAALDAYTEAGFFGMGFPEELGGMGMPYLLSIAVNGLFSAANGTVHGYSMLTVAAANMLAVCGNDEQKALYLPPMIEGRWFGTMCLSEPHAGSSLSDIKTRADRRDDGAYNISGTKMWISGGEQEISENIVHMVLARIPGGPAGVKGISLFIVPKYRVADDGSIGERNNIVLAGLNHKMGQVGITNTILNFGEGGDSVGYLVGEPHHGLHYMFHMMNEARIAVGYGATMSGLAGYLHSLEYARNRPQGRHPQDKDPTSSQVPIIEHADVRRMLLAQKAWVEGSLALGLYCASLIDRRALAESEEERSKLRLLLEILTPVAKSYPSEFCLEANKYAIQILGGYGYTKDYPVERFYRDNRLNLIHEGAHGIHGIDLLGRKVRMHGGAAFDALRSEILATADATDQQFAVEASDLRAAISRLEKTTRVVLECEDITSGLANATLYLDATGHIVMAWLWLRQAMAAAGDDDFYRGKITAMRYYFRFELPKASPLLAVVESLDTLAVDMSDKELLGS